MGTLRAYDLPADVLELAAVLPEARRHRLTEITTPLTDGRLSTFVHAGPAERVHVDHFMARFPRIPPLQRVSRDLHAITVHLPEAARLEYKLAVTAGDTTESQLDPFNPHRATDPFGANSVAYGPGYTEPWWIEPARNPAGELRRGYVKSRPFAQRRSLHWYHPPVDRPGPFRLLVVHDGSDFIDHAGIVPVLDNLIAAGAIPPLVAALVDPGDRLVEYADDARHATFVTEVVDAAARRHGASVDPADRVYLGASFGGVAALSAAWRHGAVGGLILLSGSFVTALGGPMRRGAIFEPVIDFMERFAARPGLPAPRIYQACGLYEGLAPDNRAFRPLLESTGADVRFEEVRDGHHWHNWRDRLGAALVHAFAGTDPSRAVSVTP